MNLTNTALVATGAATAIAAGVMLTTPEPITTEPEVPVGTRLIVDMFILNNIEPMKCDVSIGQHMFQTVPVILHKPRAMAYFDFAGLPINDIQGTMVCRGEGPNNYTGQIPFAVPAIKQPEEEQQ